VGRKTGGWWQEKSADSGYKDVAEAVEPHWSGSIHRRCTPLLPLRTRRSRHPRIHSAMLGENITSLHGIYSLKIILV